MAHRRPRVARAPASAHEGRDAKVGDGIFQVREAALERAHRRIRHERTRNEFRGKVVRDNGFWVQGTLRPW
jgi:hypothetical protein